MQWDMLVTQIGGAGVEKERSLEQRVIRGDHNLNPDTIPQQVLTQAAVLVPIINRRLGATVLLTERSKNLSDHPGQISFPGGRVDVADGNTTVTALREAEEEIGLSSVCVEIAGELDKYVTQTGFEITPIIGLVQPPFEIKLNTSEVVSIIEVPIELVANSKNYVKQAQVRGGKSRIFYVLPFNDHVIWGATAGMLVNLAEVLHQ